MIDVDTGGQVKLVRFDRGQLLIFWILLVNAAMLVADRLITVTRQKKNVVPIRYPDL